MTSAYFIAKSDLEKRLNWNKHSKEIIEEISSKSFPYLIKRNKKELEKLKRIAASRINIKLIGHIDRWGIYSRQGALKNAQFECNPQLNLKQSKI